MTNTPWHSRFALVLALLLPAYFAIAALGTKFGMWTWQVGLGSLIIGAGPYLLGVVALVSLVSLVLALWKAPRKGWLLSLLGLAVPLFIFAMLANVGTTAGDNPIHDVATDTANPPVFTAATLTAREEFGANPVSDYATPLGQIEWWGTRASDELKAKSHAQIVSELYPELEPVALGNSTPEAALSAIEAAMAEIGLTEISVDADSATVEGVAETFWFGFKDDVVARVADGEIDFRSVSRVGVSDLGANSARVAELHEAVQAQLGQ